MITKFQLFLLNLGLWASVASSADLPSTTPSIAAIPLDNSGPVKLKFAAQIGGASKDEFIGEEILSSGVICLAGNDGAAWIPPENWSKKWMVGEYQKWLKVGLKPSQSMLWILYPKKQGDSETTFTTGADGRSLIVKLGDETEHIISSNQSAKETNAAGHTWILKNGETTVLIERDTIPTMGK